MAANVVKAKALSKSMSLIKTWKNPKRKAKDFVGKCLEGKIHDARNMVQDGIVDPNALVYPASGINLTNAGASPLLGTRDRVIDGTIRVQGRG